MEADVQREDGILVVAGRRLEYAWWRPHAAFRDGREAAAVVLLHEGLGCLALWRDFPVQLARHTGHPVLAYSRYGYGRSDPPERPYDPGFMHDEARRALPELLAQFGIGQPLLVGHSDGASIALIFGGTWPERPKAVVALAPHLFVEPLTVESIAAARARFADTDLQQRMQRYHIDPAATFGAWADVWLSEPFAQWNIEREVAKLDCPVLAIQGVDDQYGTLRQVERIAELHPDTRVVALSDCRHSPHLDQPEVVLRHIREFTEQVAPAMSAWRNFN
ncbi:MAG: alpha/beta fold hydrolase [Burkholderiales bacterium]|nr:MAG: alpha/beta fold hydrolase [Burkholderiales bacterium]